MTIFNIWSNLIQYKRNDVGLHGEEENITLVHCLFVASGEIHTQSLDKKKAFLVFHWTKKTQKP